jgi:AcrR family transcriptional regulator
MPRKTLTKEQIVRAAVGLLDDEGLEGLNMRALGERLGSAATAIYWHVRNKDDLVILAGDELWSEVALPDLGIVDWRTAATTMATSMYAMTARHTWLVMAFASQPVHGPNKARHDEHTLGVFEKAGFAAAEADRAAAAVFTYVLGHALGLSVTASVDRRLARGKKSVRDSLQESLDRAVEVTGQFPRLRERRTAYADDGYATAPRHSFEFGLQAMLNGFEEDLRARRKKP